MAAEYDNRAVADRASQTILVVEDDVLIRMDTSEALRRRGYNILEAANGDEAVRILRSGVLVSLVFTDVQMPGTLDGVELAKHVREYFPDTICVVTSGNLANSNWPADLGTFIPKPYAIERIAGIIDRHLPATSRKVKKSTSNE